MIPGNQRCALRSLEFAVMTMDICQITLPKVVAEVAVGEQKETDMLLVAMRDLINARSKPQSFTPHQGLQSGTSHSDDHSQRLGEPPAEDPGFIPARVRRTQLMQPTRYQLMHVSWGCTWHAWKCQP